MHKAEQLITELGSRLGIEMKFERGATDLIDMQGHAWHIEASDETGTMLLSTELERDFGDSARMRHWMKLNHRFDLTGGAVIALDDELKRYNLNLLLDMSGLRVENLERHILVLMDVRDALLAQTQVAARPPVEVEEPLRSRSHKPLNTKPLSSSSLNMAKLQGNRL